jgi:hypothetical protein
MSIERHSSDYRPKHRPKGHKVVRGTGRNAGSKFDHELLREHRLLRRARKRKAEKRE